MQLPGEKVSQVPRTTLIWLVLIILLIAFFLLDIFLGSVSLHPSEVLKVLSGNGDSDATAIILKFRIPKALTSVLVGIALSVSGIMMQTIFRNPMAGPDVMGISSGAGLGVALVILGFSPVLTPDKLHGLGNWAIVVSSWIGAGVVMLLVMFISVRIREILTVLILGIMLSSGISAVVSVLQYFSSETLLKAYVIWTMGSLGNLTSEQLQVLSITILAGLTMSLLSVKMLNALLLGEHYASSIGVNVRLARVLVFTSTSILAGSVTAFCGPIGFVGIAVPHIARYLVRSSRHGILIPATILTGSIIMLFSDIVSQLPGTERLLPVNSVTSFIGIPVVIWVILRNRKISVSV